MPHFVGTVTNKIDAKGRVSIPASFRQLCDPSGPPLFYFAPSIQSAAIDGFAPSRIDEIVALVETFDPLTEEHDEFARALLADMTPMQLDGEGRVVLPADLRQHAGLADQVTFVGLGTKFQLWEPVAHASARMSARQTVQAKGHLLKRLRPANDRGGP